MLLRVIASPVCAEWGHLQHSFVSWWRCIFTQEYLIHMYIGSSKNYLSICCTAKLMCRWIHCGGLLLVYLHRIDNNMYVIFAVPNRSREQKPLVVAKVDLTRHGGIGSTKPIVVVKVCYRGVCCTEVPIIIIDQRGTQPRRHRWFHFSW